jgi:hypothetical protein
VFGPEKDQADHHAGALVVGDARLLALPGRSFRGTFAWTTSPLLLTLARRDLEDLAKDLPVPGVSCGAQVAEGSCLSHNGRLYLEDLDLPMAESTEATAWARLLAPLASPGDDIFTKRFAVVDDDTMAFLWETATQVDARVLRSLVEDDTEGHTLLSAAGDLIFKAARERLAMGPRATWPPADSRPPREKDGLSGVLHHRPGGWSQFVTWLCEIDCVRFVRYDAAAGGGPRVKVIDAENGVLGVCFGEQDAALPLRVETTAREAEQCAMVAAYIKNLLR